MPQPKNPPTTDQADPIDGSVFVGIAEELSDGGHQEREAGADHREDHRQPTSGLRQADPSGQVTCRGQIFELLEQVLHPLKMALLATGKR